ncbi:MAG: adenosine kinase [Alphaproteobacteria bacterium]
MSDAAYDVLAIGNAIVDVLAQTEEAFLTREGLAKGAMTLIDAEQAAALYNRMPPGIEMSGGSAGNTAAGVAALGGRAAYIGKVRDDQLGQIFAHDLKALGVAFPVVPALDGPATARCLIFVTPDAQRTMQTYLGACVGLTPDDVNPDAVARAAITYLEGYLWDPPAAKEAFLKAARAAHDAGRQVALTLSDAFCVDRHRASFRDLVAGHVDVLFANESEILSLYQTGNFDDALQAVRGDCRLAFLTRSEKGSVIVTPDEVHVIDPWPVARVVDTTGAGDLYAAGALYGIARGLPLGQTGRIASAAAAEVIGHYGARPEADLKAMADQAMKG